MGSVSALPVMSVSINAYYVFIPFNVRLLTPDMRFYWFLYELFRNYLFKLRICFFLAFPLYQAEVACSNNKIMDVSNKDARSNRRWQFTPYLLTTHVTDLVIARPNTLSPVQVMKSLMRNDRIFMNDALESL